jgi:OPT family small oligopeptide transporter
VTISGLVAQLVAYPIGCAWARWVPLGVLNPDRKFNIKEHALITIMANVSFGSAGASQIIEAIVKFYNLPSQGGFEVLLMVTTQLFGFGLAGMFYPILVPPAKLLWPGILSNAALFSTLHSQTNVIANGWKIPRLRFFLYVFTIGGIWYLLPGFFFTALSYFTFICWISPTNVTVNQLFGQYSGLGMSMLTFDWAQVVYANQSPLLTPLWAGLNVFGGFVIFFWIICPILYYTNTWYSAYLPIMSPSTYDNTGKVYNTSRILDHNAELDISAYQNYSPMFLPASFALTYGVAFANLTGIFVHLFLNHRDILSSSWKGDGKKDIHARLSARYERIPWWWFVGFTVMVFILTIVANVVWRTDLPIWAVFLSFILPLIYFVPVAIIKALTNISTNQLNLITEFIGGYAFLGKPVANMVFKFYGYVGLAQGIE